MFISAPKKIWIRCHLELSILYLIIGNSGAGKDSLIKAVRSNYPEGFGSLKIPRRVVTRDTTYDAEVYESVDVDTFLKMRNEGEFILDWESFENYYGIRKEVLNWLEEGNPVMINISRSVVEYAKGIFPRVKVIFVHVPLEVTADRIIDRGRETFEEVLDRLVRAQGSQEYQAADLVVENEGDLERISKRVIGFMIYEVYND